MERHALFIRSDQRVKLDNLAAEAKVSIAEIARRAIDAFELHGTQKELELELIAEAVIKSSKQAVKSLKEAHTELRNTLSHLSR